MENKYLNLTGAVYIISKIKTLLGDKSDKGHKHSKEEIGLGNVENKSSQTIRGELTSDNVIKALGYTPPKENTTYAVMKGATASAAGTSGLVPAPAAGDQGKYLRGDGTYGTPTNTTYSDATQTAHGLMSVSDKKKLDGIAEGTNNTQAASTAFVTSAISTAMAGITKLDFQVVQTLPSTGAKGTFYLIANSGSGQNVYDEYLWINNKYEKLGTREIDLSSYIKRSDMVAITNSEIDAAFA